MVYGVVWCCGVVVTQIERKKRERERKRKSEKGRFIEEGVI